MRFFTPLEEGQTPLHELAFLGTDVSKLNWLLAQGAPVNAQDDRGWTPLIYAIRRGRADMVAALLAAGASTTIRDNEGLTPLMHAAQKGGPAVVQLLLKAGVNVNDEISPLNDSCYTGHTALHYGVQSNDPVVVQLLLAAKADTNTRNVMGHTAHDLAILNGNMDMARLLSNYSQVRNRTLQRTV